jgi:hypothetical protein
MACRSDWQISLNPAKSHMRPASVRRLRSVAWEHMFAASTFHLATVLRRAGAWLRAFAFLDDAPVHAPPPTRLTREHADHRRLVPAPRPPARRGLHTTVEYRRPSVGRTPQRCVTAAAARRCGDLAHHTTELDEPTPATHHRHDGDRLLQGGERTRDVRVQPTDQPHPARDHGQPQPARRQPTKPHGPRPRPPWAGRKRAGGHNDERAAREGDPSYTKTGGVLLSQALAGQVPSALRGLTALFGKGRGVSPSP